MTAEAVPRRRGGTGAGSGSAGPSQTELSLSLARSLLKGGPTDAPPQAERLTSELSEMRARAEKAEEGLRNAEQSLSNVQGDASGLAAKYYKTDYYFPSWGKEVRTDDT